jgi:hypothetical protein
MAARVVPKVCNLCEAMCGLRIHVDGPQILRIEADPDDPLSRGAICPKAIGLKEVQEDPDRLRHPLRRRGNDFEEISWDEALGETADRVADLQRRHGNEAVASYLGNPGAHNLGVLFALPVFNQVLDTRNKMSASSLDQNPKHAASILLFGNFLSIPVPDLDRTGFLLVLGANPVISGGSLMSGTWRSHPGRTACSWQPSSTRCSTRSSAGTGPATSACAGSTGSAPRWRHSRRKPSQRASACRPARSVPWPATLRPRPPPSPTAVSAPPSTLTARSPPGSSMSSTC